MPANFLPLGCPHALFSPPEAAPEEGVKESFEVRMLVFSS